MDDALGSVDTEIIGQAIEGYFQSLKNVSGIKPISEARWQVATRFVRDTLIRLIKSRATEPKLDEFDRRLARLEMLWAQLRVGRQRKPESIRSLPAVAVEAMYELLDPSSPTNPFTDDRTRWRIWITFLLLLHQGLRRAELLNLPVDAIKNGFDTRLQRERYWIAIRYNEYEEDLRFSKPGIKTAGSFRQIPVSDLTATLVDEYVTNYRGHPNHSFLISSQQNTPLSTEGVTKHFQKLSRSLPKGVLHALHDYCGEDSISPHNLRHTCAVLRLNQFLTDGTDREVALQLMRAFFGWSRSSDMPLRYSRAVFEDRLAAIWRNEFDGRVGVLRNLRELQ